MNSCPRNLYEVLPRIAETLGVSLYFLFTGASSKGTAVIIQREVENIKAAANNIESAITE
jgi:hypothetical protein